MSFSRENVIWQSANGTWNIGFFECTEQHAFNDRGEECDPEWDVDYDFSKFNWASTGHSSQDAARDAWHGANPGGSWTCEYSKKNASECDKYDRMAKDYLEGQRPQQPRARFTRF